MFSVYHSNLLDLQKDILLKLLESTAAEDPFASQAILVQSVGMERWLQMEIAKANGIAANIQFPMPASFIWQQYQVNFNLLEQNRFDKQLMRWWLMELIPDYLTQPAFTSLAHYLQFSHQSEQKKLYQLSGKIADLFDQYLVYRPEWIIAWELNKDEFVHSEIKRQLLMHSPNSQLIEQVERDITWQGELWRALVDKISTNAPILHRAKLNQLYIQKLSAGEVKYLPQHLFIFGISTLPRSYLELLYAMGQQENCHIHLFFNNPSPYYWEDIHSGVKNFAKNDRTLLNLLTQLSDSQDLSSTLDATFFDDNENTENNAVNPLLSSWGKLGRDFLHTLTQLDDRSDIEAFVEPKATNLLEQVKLRIYQVNDETNTPLVLAQDDHSLSFHSCHTPMREVEVLQDHLLSLFENDPELTPKDIIVMIADIDKYTPYIQAVFGQYQAGKDKRYIPFSIADRKLSENDVLVSSFLRLLNLKDSLFSAEEILTFLDVPAIREKFQISLLDLPKIRYWVKNAGIRFGIGTENAEANYNSWLKGIERILLGYALREESGVWQDLVGFESSYGLQGQLAGLLAQFITQLYKWRQVLIQQHSVEQWKMALNSVIDDFFITDEQWNETILIIKNSVSTAIEQMEQTELSLSLTSDVVYAVLSEELEQSDNHFKFMLGKVSFCTLVPMRSIPFKVVCLLGMNEKDYPRQKVLNSFDLMQYHKQRGDRSRREDDKYLFLEALLSAQQQFYVSYIGRSVIDNVVQEPSPLFSQLLDYIADNAQTDFSEPTEIRQHLVKQHTMTAFYPQNFMGQAPSFAYQWLEQRQSHNEKQDFIQPVELEVEPIKLFQLIQFVVDPIKAFFNHKLGTYFSQLEDLIDEHENFTLAPLQRYQVKEDLLRTDEEQYQDFFNRLAVKGLLPRGAFKYIWQQELAQDISLLKEEVRSFLSLDSTARPFSLSFTLENGQSVLLEGDINHLYNNARVSWRVGDLRDKDIIEQWLYHLLVCAVMENPMPIRFFYQNDKKSVAMLTFILIPPNEALEQLQIYLSAYIQQIQLLPTICVQSYMKLLAKGNSSVAEYEQAILKNAETNPYWQRVLAQTKQMDIIAINEKMQTWFGLMERCKSIS